MKVLISPEELIGKSLQGKMSNVNIKRGIATRPSLDEIRLNTIL
jgi:hypothetical protein